MFLSFLLTHLYNLKKDKNISIKQNYTVSFCKGLSQTYSVLSDAGIGGMEEGSR